MNRDSNAARPARRDLPQPDRGAAAADRGAAAADRAGRTGSHAGGTGGPSEGADARDVRELILDGTERLLDARRFESLSVADILDAAGVSRGSFYFYFANKHAVLAELVRRAVSGAREAAGTWADDVSGAPGEALRRGTAEGTRLWRERAPVLRAIVENWQADPALARLWAETMDGFATVATERIIADRGGPAGPGGDPRDSDPRDVGPRDDGVRALAAILCWMNERAWYLAAIGHPGFTDEARLTHALTEVWQAAVYGTAASPARNSLGS